MKRTDVRVVLLSCALPAALAAEPPAPRVSLDPPPGWSDAMDRTRIPGALLAFQGPEGSSFVVARMPAAAVESAAATRAYLQRVLDGLRAGARRDYRASGRLETRTFRNGVTAHLMRVELGGKPRLILAALEAGGPPILGTLSSAAPDAMMESLFGGLQMAEAGAVKEQGMELSRDGQIQIALGGGLRSRELTGREIQQNVVLAVQGGGSEVVFLKIGDSDAAPKDQAAIVRATVADAAKIPLNSVSPARRASTPAGPSGVYAWAALPGSPDLRLAAGYLPWAYWGYSILGRGPQADELLAGVLAATQQGPAAVAKLVAASPRIEIPGESSSARRRLAAAAAAIAAVLVLIVWSLGRKSANLSG